MNKDIEISFSTDSITYAIALLEKLNNDIPNLANKIAKEVANDGYEYLNRLYESTPYQSGSSDISTSVERKIDGYTIKAIGEDVIYEEFGTGDEGQANSHPDKGKYSLNPYNSGETIRNANEKSAKYGGITSGKYWTYEKDGKIYYTQGIPAGKQVFNTRNYILKTGIPKASKKIVGDMLSKL